MGADCNICVGPRGKRYLAWRPGNACAVRGNRRESTRIGSASPCPSAPDSRRLRTAEYRERKRERLGVEVGVTRPAESNRGDGCKASKLSTDWLDAPLGTTLGSTPPGLPARHPVAEPGPARPLLWLGTCSVRTETHAAGPAAGRGDRWPRSRCAPRAGSRRAWRRVRPREHGRAEWKVRSPRWWPRRTAPNPDTIGGRDALRGGPRRSAAESSCAVACGAPRREAVAPVRLPRPSHPPSPQL